MSMKTNKQWQEYEKYQLYLAHYMRASFSVMEQYFGRSATSINKYLSRNGIRNRLKGHTCEHKIKTVDELHLLIVECGLDKETVGLERQKTRDWSASDFAIQRLKKLGLPLPAPWAKKTRPQLLPIKSGIGRSSFDKSEVFVSLDVIVHYLIRKGFAVKRYARKNPHNWTYIINNKPTSDLQVMIKGNIQRRQHREPLFLVKGLTFE